MQCEAIAIIKGWGKRNSLPTASRIPKHGSCRNGTSLPRLISCSYIGFRGRGSSSEGEAQEAGSSSMNCWRLSSYMMHSIYMYIMCFAMEMSMLFNTVYMFHYDGNEYAVQHRNFSQR